MVSLRHIPTWCTAIVPFLFIILASFSDPFLVDTELLVAFANASLFYMPATCVHMHEVYTTQTGSSGQ